MSEAYNLGKEGEQAAIDYLTQNNYTVLDVNWRYGKYEIDIICKKQDEIVFVEVKSHNNNIIFKMRLSVNKEKRRHILFAADKYVKIHQINLSARFDIIVVVKDQYSNKLSIKHYPDAFYYTR